MHVQESVVESEKAQSESEETTGSRQMKRSYPVGTEREREGDREVPTSQS